MTIQTIELHGKRHVILSERDFIEMQRKLTESGASTQPPVSPAPRFREVVPPRVGGTPASEILIQDRG